MIYRSLLYMTMELFSATVFLSDALELLYECAQGLTFLKEVLYVPPFELTWQGLGLTLLLACLCKL